MIPKVIHFCWFGGGPLTELSERCIASWRKYCPDYEIRRWDETNVDLSSVDYMREAYEEKAWAFVSDVARLQIVYEQGGIYLDTDVELVRPLDDFLQYCAFAGIQTDKTIALGLGFGAEAGHPLIGELLSAYRDRHFRRADGTLDRTAAPAVQHPVFEKNGFNGQDAKQTILGAEIYPTEYFCPMSFITAIVTLTDNTYSIHHFAASWCTENERERIRIRQKVYRKWGVLAKPVWLCVLFVHMTKKTGFIPAVCFMKEQTILALKSGMK